ncbi:ABC1 kinase family protein [Yoonia sediminilitoris]|uniref:Putative unusual protein kinase regulating ubiquinone biosynthesis (AarF/ABC1/UbiB family) n=1 Tax=Yoonia sediminilitoris TaxID=1286148 RepID=A0A2T6KPZ3_9RHOB|nr:AarF/ABC1/UbiB kinase family protein [Yoonia sediminilitoris]PUB18620.1 putative unusual protein kinase regulating ubiquinone biosynthesis (AarF/ABC1/UbiB family) [Yoonia sediminilitoris]RCW98788.1 putative unusual protein kinase regulating ubiquinone biosynthesis (AarF/ABC1/UbiB family) [Yoonia sediminilitoris]
MSQKQPDARAIPVPSRRLSRLGQLGTMTASIAGNMALNGVAQLGRGQRPSMQGLLLNPSNVRRVADQLAKMRGAAMKVGQLMSMDTGEFLPPELAQIMARLRDDAHFMPPAQLKQVLNKQWPDRWLGAFKNFDVRPIAAASIGQVHKARLKDGRELAIKVQYPGVAKSIDSDVANVGALIRMSGLLPKGFALSPYLEEGRKQLHEETDYTREAAQLARFGALLSKEPAFVVPDVHHDWSTPEILAMGFVPGLPIEQAANETQETRDRIATRLIDLALKELFVFGVMQTDPNFANYLYQPQTDRIVLLDFGATRDIDPVIAERYRKLMRAGLSNDTVAMMQTAAEIGFIGSGTTDRQRSRIERMMRGIFDALRDKALFDFADSTLSQQMQAEGMALAEDGFVPPPLPIDVLLLQRKLGGLFLLAARLKAKVDVLSLLARHLEPAP